jgi:phosphoribosylanthranilate isomerase
MAAKFELSFIQISDLSLLSTLDLGESQIILNVSVNSQQELEELQSIVATQNEKISYFLIESTNEQIHDALITAIVKSDKQEQMIIGFGLNGDNVNELLENMPNLGGFCLKGSEEERPGYNNYDEVMDVLEALEEY